MTQITECVTVTVSSITHPGACIRPMVEAGNQTVVVEDENQAVMVESGNKVVLNRGEKSCLRQEQEAERWIRWLGYPFHH